MDRRSWLWRRKSSEKSSGETESSGSGSGSISSPSERFLDEHQGYSNQNGQSPEISSKAEHQDADVALLTEKLSAALANISAKEESVKQHAKVAEEAVTGWEKAENEVISLKQQLDVATKKNSSLEDRILHLDGALKECLRQLRQVREEQDRKIQDAISKKSQDSESKQSNLEEKLADLQAQLETANAKCEAMASLESDLRRKLGFSEKENVSLRLELKSRLEELELRTLERDLSSKTAENASKQHLESIKKVAKLEAEIRKLKTMARKPTSCNDHKPLSDTWASALISELDQFKVEKAPSNSPNVPSPEINLMNDFLEMERLAALPIVENHGNGEISLKDELEASMKNRTNELEDKIKMLEEEKVELKISLAQLQVQFNECQNELKISQGQLRDANKNLGFLQAELDLANELRHAIELELEDANVRREEAESQLRAIEDESKILLSKVGFLEGEIEKERALYVETSTKCRSLEDEVFRMKHEANTQKEALENESKSLLAKLISLENEASNERRKLEEELSRMKYEADTWQSRLASEKVSNEAVERELNKANEMKDEVESQLKAIQAEAKSLLTKVATLENEDTKERIKLEEELSRMKCEADTWQSQWALANESKEVVERELKKTNAMKDEVESQLKVIQAEAKSLLAKVGRLENEAEKERKLSSEFKIKCRKLEDELSKMKCEANFCLAPFSKEELNMQQEKELAVAATKLSECQKTIASLGKQLKSLATLEDFFSDSDRLLEISVERVSASKHGITVE